MKKTFKSMERVSYIESPKTEWLHGLGLLCRCEFLSPRQAMTVDDLSMAAGVWSRAQVFLSWTKCA